MQSIDHKHFIGSCLGLDFVFGFEYLSGLGQVQNQEARPSTSLEEELGKFTFEFCHQCPHRNF